MECEIGPYYTAYNDMSPIFLPRQRGKFRPRLTELVKENSPDKVKELTTSAFSQLPKNVRKAVEILKALKAVGPATASGKVFRLRLLDFLK